MIHWNVCPRDVPAAAVGSKGVCKGPASTASGNREPHYVDRNIAIGSMGNAVRIGGSRKVVDPLMSGLMAEGRGSVVEERRNWKDRVALKPANAAEGRAVSKERRADALNTVFDLHMVAVAPHAGDMDEV